MTQNRFPEGWDNERVQRVLAPYESQNEDQALTEDEEGMKPSVTVINIPHEVLSEVRELIAKRCG